MDPNTHNTAAALPEPAKPFALIDGTQSRIVADLKDVMAHVEENQHGRLLIADSGIKDVPKLPFFARPGQAPESLAGLIDSYTKLIEETQGGPRRRKGTATTLDLQGFIDHANRFKRPESVVFAINDMAKPSLTAVLDYHQAGAAGAARFGTHRTHYAFPLAKEWLAWMEGNAVAMKQPQFAEWLEDRAMDIIDPPDFVHAAFDKQSSDPAEIAKSEALLALEAVSARLGVPYATTNQIMNLAKGLALTVEAKSAHKVNLGSGEGTLQYDEVHKDSSGEQLRVPGLFLIAIPVFAGELPYRVIVRLRYRIVSGSVIWFYQIHRPDLTFEAAFKGALAKVRAGTDLPLILGTPE